MKIIVIFNAISNLKKIFFFILKFAITLINTDNGNEQSSGFGFDLDSIQLIQYF